MMIGGAMMLLVGRGYAAAPPSPPPIAFPGVEWAEVSPERAGLDEAKLVSGLAALSEHGDVGRVMVTRWGSHVALPSAPASHNLSEPAPVWSVSKSLVALSTGLLLQNGSLALDDTLPLSNDPAQAAEALGIPATDFAGAAAGGPLRTVRQFMSMTSDFGIRGGEPGKNGAYNNAAIHYYGHLIAKEHFHLSPSEMVEHLFSLVGGHQDPITLPAHGKLQLAGYGGGFSVSPRDLARLGLLLLADGKWDGEELLSASWVDQAMSPQAVGVSVQREQAGKVFNELELSSAIPFNASGHWERMGGDVGYGFSLWVLPGGKAHGAHMSGVGGQYVIIDRQPGSGLVIVVENNPNPIHDPKPHPTAGEYLEAVRAAMRSGEPQEPAASSRRALQSGGSGCAWTNTPDQNCGWSADGSCVTNTPAGAGGTVAYDTNKMPEDLDSCKAACEAKADCVAVNYAHPGTGGSGGPGQTSRVSGTCYYRSGTACGLQCQSGRDCWRLSGSDGVETARPSACSSSATVTLAADTQCAGEGSSSSGGAVAGVVAGVAVVVLVVVGVLASRRTKRGQHEAAPVVAQATVVPPQPPVVTAVAVVNPAPGSNVP